MQLNIYTISHPIIKLLTDNKISNGIYEKFQTNNDKYITLFLIYEISRKWIKINHIYIKQFNYIKEITILNHREKYFLCTYISKNYNILPEIKMLIPQIEIVDTENNLEIFKKNFQQKIKDFINKDIQILIFEKTLLDSCIINVLNYLTISEYIPIQHINIACIYCNHQTLNIIGNQYSQLKIYTTKIIQ
uniref:Uracil phosphoribosyltransferase n=1 Tax=Anotrichium furcellatum TaxID=41999 RepID=A0A4D6WP07_9FLOR|nr:hypothetical protein [Anotrichium furcellatum]